MIMLASAFILILHMPGNFEVTINVEAIVSLKVGHKGPDLIHDHVNCLVSTNDGKFTGVVESCAEIRAMMRGGKDAQ